MDPVIKLVLIALASYIIGSFPTAVVISKLFFGFDIREKGSGNMGSTNAFRVLGWKWGVVTQLVDILKGFVAVVFLVNIFGHGISFPSINMFEDITVVRLIAGITAVIGHIWSVFVSFRGGKGINTAAGMLIGIAPVDVGIAILFFILAVIFSGYISLGSITASVVFPSSIFVRYNLFGIDIEGYLTLIYFALGLMLLLIFQHRTNIIRLVAGNENRFHKLHLIKIFSRERRKNKMN